MLLCTGRREQGQACWYAAVAGGPSIQVLFSTTQLVWDVLLMSQDGVAPTVRGTEEM